MLTKKIKHTRLSKRFVDTSFSCSSGIVIEEQRLKGLNIFYNSAKTSRDLGGASSFFFYQEIEVVIFFTKINSENTKTFAFYAHVWRNLRPDNASSLRFMSPQPKLICFQIDRTNIHIWINRLSNSATHSFIHPWLNLPFIPILVAWPLSQTLPSWALAVLSFPPILRTRITSCDKLKRLQNKCSSDVTWDLRLHYLLLHYAS